MLQYKIPQNVQIEDRITSFLTVRQLIICAIGGGIIYMIYIWLSKYYYAEVWLPPVFILSAITLAVAFVKINGLTFTKWTLLFLEHMINPKKRVWDNTKTNELFFSFVTSKRTTKKKEAKKEQELEEKDFTALEEITARLDSNPFENIKKTEKKQEVAKKENFSDHSILLDDKERERHEQRLEEAILANIKPKNPQKIKKSLQEKITKTPQKEAKIEIEHEIKPLKSTASVQKREFAIPEIATTNPQTTIKPQTASRFRPVREKKINTVEKPQVPEDHKEMLSKKGEKEIKVNFVPKKDER